MGETGVLGWRHRRYRDHDYRLWLAGLDTGQYRGVPGTGTGEYGSCRRLHAYLRREVHDATRCPGQTDGVPKNECLAATRMCGKGRVGHAAGQSAAERQSRERLRRTADENEQNLAPQLCGL